MRFHRFEGILGGTNGDFSVPGHSGKGIGDLREIPLETRQEALREGTAAAASVLAKHFRPARGNDKHEIIVSHGNLIRYLVAHLLADSGNNWSRMGIRNCGITEVLVRPNGRRVILSFNDVGHLPHALQT